MQDLVQVLNPATGYLQNCNIGPDTMARGLGLDPAAYPSYIYHERPGSSNSRGRRAVELLEAHPKLTVEEAMAIVMDTHADGCGQWQEALRQALKTVELDENSGGAEPAALRKAAATLLAWNGMMDQESTGATLYRGWRTYAEQRHLGLDSRPEALVGALGQAVAWLVAQHGSGEVPYGQLHRLRRGGHSWPISGGEPGGGSTLRAVSSTLEDKIYYGHGGQNWTQLVQFRPGAVRSWSATPYGQSDDPASPHYADQAAKLYSPSRLKPTWFQAADLQGNIESTRVLAMKAK
jgi:acyl-homoserine lactone acylase PvdQ